MTEQEFWHIIEKSKKHTERDVEVQCENLVNILVRLEEREIAGFDIILSELLRVSYTSRLWAAGYIINGGCSDDGFEYFRCWLISRGQKVFTAALEDPEKLTRYVSTEVFDEAENEELLYVATTAFEQKTGKSMEDFSEFVDSLTDVVTPYPAIEHEWEEENVGAYLPKLWKKFKSIYE